MSVGANVPAAPTYTGKLRLDEHDLLGHGSYGIVYKAVLPINSVLQTVNYSHSVNGVAHLRAGRRQEVHMCQWFGRERSESLGRAQTWQHYYTVVHGRTRWQTMYGFGTCGKRFTVRFVTRYGSVTLLHYSGWSSVLSEFIDGEMKVCQRRKINPGFLSSSGFKRQWKHSEVISQKTDFFISKFFDPDLL
jgi:hypothetical protein